MADEIEGTVAPAETEVTVTATEEAPKQQDEPQFHDPQTLPEDLAPHWKKMQASFTRKMQALSQERQEMRDKVGELERLRTDPAYARQVILDSAERLGLEVKPAGSNGHSTTQAPSSVPPELVSAIKARLSPELQWMAESIAAANWEANKHLTAPILERQEREQKSRRAEDYDRVAEKFSTKVPDWNEHEEEMAECLAFLQSPRLEHPTFGSKLELLYNLVTGHSAAKLEAVRRMAEAPRQRTTTGRAETHSTTNLADVVRKAPTTQDAWEAAAKAALESLKQ